MSTQQGEGCILASGCDEALVAKDATFSLGIDIGGLQLNDESLAKCYRHILVILKKDSFKQNIYRCQS